MYRELILLLIISAVTCHCHHACRKSKISHSRYRNNLVNRIELIGRELQTIDGYFEDLCTQNKDRTTETYGDDYILKYSLPEYKNPNVTVKVNYRIIYTTVEAEGKTFKDARLLPNILNIDDAGWQFEDGALYIVFPYSIKLDEENPVKCASVNSSMLQWRDINWKIQLRFGND